MKNILFIKTSLNGEQSSSNKLADQLVKKYDSPNVVIRDLALQPLPHLSQAEMATWAQAPQSQSPNQSNEQQQLAQISEQLINELQHSDTVIIGLPMYNFGVPSNFKAWADRVARAGITFRYTENGPQGLLKDKQVIVVATRGGFYQGTAQDSQTQFIKDFFNFIGLEDVRFIYAEGLNMPDGDKNFAKAQSAIEHFTI